MTETIERPRYIDAKTTDFDTCLDLTIRSLTAAHELSNSLMYPSFVPEVYGFDPGGKKYIRVWHDNGTQRFVCFFVERATGDVWKAAGWKSPALNFTRGNILSPEGRAALTIGKIHPTTGYFYPSF